MPISMWYHIPEHIIPDMAGGLGANGCEQHHIEVQSFILRISLSISNGGSVLNRSLILSNLRTFVVLSSRSGCIVEGSRSVGGGNALIEAVTLFGVRGLLRKDDSRNKPSTVPLCCLAIFSRSIT